MIEYKRLAKERKKKRIVVALISCLAVICLLTGAYFLCTVRKVEVVGNKLYSAKQIEDLALPSKWDYNTVYLWYKTRHTDIKTPPFLDMMEIEIVSYNEIRIRVYEKTIMGYVEYMGNYVYFDKDGIVLETSAELKEGFPVVKGLAFDNVVLYERLPVKNKEIFQTLVSLTQMLEKNELNPDCIEFTGEDEMDLTFGEVLVHLGKDSSLDNKIARLKGILPSLVNRSGILFMEDVDESTERITFKKTLSKAEQEALQQEQGTGDGGEYDNGEDTEVYTENEDGWYSEETWNEGDGGDTGDTWDDSGDTGNTWDDSGDTGDTWDDGDYTGGAGNDTASGEGDPGWNEDGSGEENSW